MLEFLLGVFSLMRVVSRRRGGNILIIALVLMLILVTLVSALHHYEVTSRRAASDAEADLAMIQSKKWALGVALNKAVSSEAPSLPVTLTPTYTNATVMTTANVGKEIFSRDGNGDWDGLPDLTIKRQANPTNTTLPPNFTEMRLSPKSINPMIGSMGKYRQLITDQMPLAAYAPKGNVALDSAFGWANPEFGVGDKNTRQEYSGLPITVAAGGNVSFTGDFPHGTVYSASNDTNAIVVNGTSLASRVVGPLPFGKTESIEGTMITQLDMVARELEDTAKRLDDKTRQISGTPPEITEIVNFFFSDCLSGDSTRIKNKLLNWLSVRCAFEFPFCSLPGFATTAFPGCYVAFQFWFHGPHPPDTVGYSSTGAPSNAVTKLYEKRAEYTAAKARAEYLLSQLEGGVALIEGPSKFPGAGQEVYKPRGNPDCVKFAEHPTEPPYTCANCSLGDSLNSQGRTANNGNPGAPARVSVGLIDRFKSDTQMMRDLKADVADLETKVNNKDLSLKTDTRVKQDILMWIGDCKGYLYDDSGNQANVGVSGYAFTGVNGFGSISTVNYDLRPPTTDAPAPDLRDNIYGADAYVATNNAYRLSRTTFSHQKDWQGNDMGVRDTTASAVVTRKFTSPDTTMRAGDAITMDMWKSIVVKKDGKTGGDARDQLMFLRYLLRQSENPHNYPDSIYFRIRKLRDDLNAKKNELADGIRSVDTAIGVLRGPAETLQERLSKLPLCAKEESEKEPFKSDSDFQKDKGMIGMSYLRFGFSYDVMVKIIEWLASSSGNMNDLWTTRVPLVFWGSSTNKSPLNLANALDIKGSFVIPAGRTLYYENPMTITGTLWVQRGATLVVKGDLSVINSLSWLQAIADKSASANDVMSYLCHVPGQAAGKVVLEEGANIVVRGGDMKVDGALQCTGAMNKQRPISCSILVPDGRVTLRAGTSGGLTLSDAFTWKELSGTGKTINKNIIHPYLYAFAPNAAKVYGFGPFKRRKCFFARWATQYQLSIFIGPFGIPIPIMHPWPIPRDNIQVTLYKGLSYFYAVLANINMGENLQTHTMYMPFVMILPKLDFTATSLSSIDFAGALSKLGNISMPSFDSKFFTDTINKLNPANGEMWEALVNKLLADVVRDTMISMIPAPWNMAVSAALGAILPPRSNDTPTGPMADALGGFGNPLSGLASSIPGVEQLYAERVKVSTGMLRDVHGAVVFAKEVLVGYDTSGNPIPSTAQFASGLFIARNFIGMNADYVVGSMICANGSIAAGHAKLLHLPQFTRASLNNPDRNPGITAKIPTDVPQFLRRALDVEYGPYQNRNQTGLDVGFPRKWVMMEGWER